MASKDSNEGDKPDNSEDNFGLPDLNYKPLDQNSGTPAKEVASSEKSNADSSAAKVSAGSYSDSSEDEPKSNAPVILGVVIILVLVVAGYLIYNFVYKPKAEAEKAKQEQLAKAAIEKKRQEEAALAARKAEEERLRLEALAKAKPAVGTIETLTARTKRYYVVVTSNIDDDLMMDFAKKLSTKGISTKIIPPIGEKKFYHLAIADHDTYKLAQSNADALKADYGDKVWVMKY